ncbi:MAG: lysylphosphatidylglycerol synthase transmembrane domain-containing protein [Anaerolineae bacterium]
MHSPAQTTQHPGHFWTVLRWGVGLGLAGLTTWLSLREVNWTGLKAAISRPNWLFLLVALSTVLATTAAKAFRWQVLLRPCHLDSAHGWRIMRLLFTGQIVNTLVPRLGDLARAVLLGPQATGHAPAVLGTIIAEKALDGIAGLLVVTALALRSPLPVWLRGPMFSLAILTGGLLLLLVLAARQQPWAIRLYQRVITWLPPGVQERASRLLGGLALGLGLLVRPTDTFLALTWTAGVWGLAVATNLVTLAALGISTPPWSVWLVLIAVYVATFLPTVPVQIGVFEYACILALETAGVEPDQALAFGLVLHFLVYAPVVVFGPVSMAIEGLDWEGLKIIHKTQEVDCASQ